MKSKTSAVEVEMKEMCILCNDIIEGSHLTTGDAKKLVGLLEKGLMKIEELRISRDNHSTKCQELREQRDSKISDGEIKKITLKAFKMGQKKYQANDYSIKLWIAGELEELKKVKCKKKKSGVEE